MSAKLAYLSQGKLYYKNGGQASPIDSPFGQDIIHRALQRQQKQEWKTGAGDGGGMYNRSALWGVSRENPNAVRVHITAVTRGTKENELLYVLDTDTVGGMFTYDLESKKETRLFHKEGLFLKDLDRHSSGDPIVCAQKFPNGTTSIALCRGNDVEQITEGDSVDEAPSWVPVGPKAVVYQSAGVARNSAGYFVGLGPASIQKLNLDTGELCTLAEDPACDFLCPHLTASGDLFYIQRPYETPEKRNYPFFKMILDVLLFPFRMIYALFGFLNFFSMTFSRKPLTTASGPLLDTPGQKHLLLKGRMIDAEEALKKGAQSDEPPSLVPESWRLVKRSAAGQESVLAGSVLCYDLSAEGKIFYSNGTAIYQLDPDGKHRQMVLKDSVIDTVVAL
jgi:hypothetical protein